MGAKLNNNDFKDFKNGPGDPNDLKNDLNDPKNVNNDFDKDYPVFKDKLEIQVSELIRKNPELTYKEMGEIFNVSLTTIKRTLTKMKHEGRVIREGSKRKGKWILIDK